MMRSGEQKLDEARVTESRVTESRVTESRVTETHAELERSNGKSFAWAKRNPLEAFGILIGALVVLASLFAPLLTRFDPTGQDLRSVLQGFSGTHPLGTDQLGRDLLARVLFAGRTSLPVVALVLTSSLALGLIVGIAAGLAGGWIDEAIMRAVDVLLALPSLVLTTAIVGVLGPGLEHLIPAIVFSWWPMYARLVRAQVLVLRETQMVLAARALGGTEAHIARRHVLPALAGPLAVQLALDAGHVLMTVAGLSFLGLGVQPPTPEWGAMLTEARAFMQSAPHLIVAPGIAVIATVFGSNALAEWLEEALGPRR